MEKNKNAMRFLNNLGNLFFQFIISLVIKQKLTDSLCGTKVFKKKILNIYISGKTKISKDPFGDFDLIFFRLHILVKRYLNIQFITDQENMEKLKFQDFEMVGSFYFIS